MDNTGSGSGSGSGIGNGSNTDNANANANPHQEPPPNPSFATPSRSTAASHAEAHAALAAFAAAASSGSIQMTPPQPLASSSTSSSYPSPSPTPSTPLPNSASPFGTHLGRNKACQSCRARKLKCDGQKPVCSQCAKAWAIKFRMAHNKSKNKKNKNSDPNANDQLNNLPDQIPPCVYLPIAHRQSSASKSSAPNAANASSAAAAAANSAASPGNDDSAAASPLPASKKRKRTDDQSEHVSRLLSEIDQLKQQLAHFVNQPYPPNQQPQSSASGRHPSKDELAIAHMLAGGMPSGEEPQSQATFPPYSNLMNANPIVNASAPDSSNSNNTTIGVLDPALDPAFYAPTTTATPYPQPDQSFARMAVNDPELHAKVDQAMDQEDPFTSPLLELMVTSWPADFPPPTAVTLLVTTYLEACPLNSLFVHPPRFLERLSLGPQHPLFPDRGILHGMFAHAYPRLKPHELSAVASAPLFGPPHPTGGHGEQQPRKGNPHAAAAAFHAERARAMYTRSANQGKFLEAAKILALLAGYNYLHDRSFDAWTTLGTLSSLAKAMELNRLPPISSLVASDNEKRARRSRKKAVIFRASVHVHTQDVVEHEERLRLFWNSFYSDRTACASTFWAQNVDDGDILSELPGAFQDFIECSPALAHRPRQTLQSHDLFTAKHYDPALLHLKAGILHSKCINYISRQPHEATVEEVLTSQFHHLDNTITLFVQSFPPDWRDVRTFDPALMPSDASEPSFLSDGINNRNSKSLRYMTIQLVMAHALTFGMTIALHEPVAPHVPESSLKSALAADAIVNLIKIFVAARTDMGQLGSIITLMIVFAGRCNARRYKTARARAAAAYREIRTPGDSHQSIEEEMEAAMELDPSIQPMVDPDNAIAQLRDDLELIFWSLVKYGEKFPLGGKYSIHQHSVSLSLSFASTVCCMLTVLFDIQLPPQSDKHVLLLNS